MADKDISDGIGEQGYLFYDKNGNECHNFGINHGCKPWCPVFMEGKCRNEQECIEQFKINKESLEKEFNEA